MSKQSLMSRYALAKEQSELQEPCPPEFIKRVSEFDEEELKAFIEYMDLKSYAAAAYS